MDYIKEGLKHLNDPTTYRKLNKDATLETKREINKLLGNIKCSQLMHWCTIRFANHHPYTNIPHNKGLEASTNFLLDHKGQDPIRPHIQILRELIEYQRTICFKSMETITYNSREP